MSGTLAFRPYFVQRGVGPHLLDWAYASDERWDAFHSDIAASDAGVTISSTGSVDRFGINVRWNVEGFGYLFLTADNGGDFYSLPRDGRTETRNLNFELAKSRIARNRRRVSRFREEGWRPTREIEGYASLSETYLDDARKVAADEERGGALSQKALYYALWASEMLELDYARFSIDQIGFRPDFFVGCDARAFYQMRTPEIFMDLFEQAFNYATITYVWEHDGVSRGRAEGGVRAVGEDGGAVEW